MNFTLKIIWADTRENANILIPRQLTRNRWFKGENWFLELNVLVRSFLHYSLMIFL